jgi:prepilin peptidase CpaA
VAAWGDIRTRTIPNWLNLTIALAAPASWWASGMSPWPDMAIQVGIAALVFALFAGAFALGMMGGGDVKLIAALALWLPFGPLFDMLLLMAVLGGVLTLVMLVLHRLQKAQGQPEIPYGVAIALAGIVVLANQNLTSSVH